MEIVMTNIFLMSIFTFLVAYAIIDIFYEIAEIILNKFSRVCPKDYIVLPLSDNIENLDGAIRVSLKRSQNHRCALVIVCKNLGENEQQILKRLTEHRSNVVICNSDNLPDALLLAEKINQSLCAKK